MDPQQMRQFQVIAELGNLSRAALELHVAQPSLSVSIAKLERELGTQLFQRSRKGMKLTASGQHLLSFCERALKDWSQLQSDLTHLSVDVAGTIQLGVHPSVAAYTLPHFLPQLLSDHPALNVQLTHDLSRRLLERLAQQELDVGLIINPEPRPNLVIRPLFDDEVTVFKLAGLLNKNILIYDPNLAQVQAIRRQLDFQKIHFARVIESDNLEVIRHLLVSGCGQAILPRRTLGGRALAGRALALAPAPITESFPDQIKPVRDRLALVYAPEFLKTAKGKTFANAVRDWSKI